MTGERTELGSNVVLGVGCRENARKHGSARLRLEGTSPRATAVGADKLRAFGQKCFNPNWCGCLVPVSRIAQRVSC